MLDLYSPDQQLTQLARTHELAAKHLAEMQAQRAELDEAIAELSAQMDWGQKEMARLATNVTAAA